MKLFSKARRNNLPDTSQGRMSKFRKYLFYALGEIILVVIGILVAVSINNWNEQKKERQKLTTYLKDYRNDLIIDSSVVGATLKVLESRKDAFDLVLSDSLNNENLLKNPMVFSLVLTYNPIKFQSKGYNELKTYISDIETEKDTLVQRIVSEHAAYHNYLDTTIKNISEDIADNMHFLKSSKPWLSELFANNLSDDVIDYYLSKDYKNRVAVHKVLVYGNMETFLKGYQSYIEKTLNSLNERLEED
jgi:hypothetical protein